MSTAETASRGANGKAKDAPVVEDVRGLTIPEIEMRGATLHIVGLTPLIVHRWSEKAIKALEGSQTGKAKSQREHRVPDEERKAAAYVVPGREDYEDWKPGKYFLPGAAFKHAFLYGVGQLDDVKNFPKTKATSWFFVGDDPILGFDSVTERTDIGRNPTQMIYRPQFNAWTCPLSIRYNARTISLEQVVSLMNYGGLGGVGEWRPSAPKNKSGSFGMFEVSKVEA